MVAAQDELRHLRVLSRLFHDLFILFVEGCVQFVKHLMREPFVVKFAH